MAAGSRGHRGGYALIQPLHAVITSPDESEVDTSYVFSSKWLATAIDARFLPGVL